MARDTYYVLYKTGRTDPTFKNIWAFDSLEQRGVWLTSKCSPYMIQNVKYWRPGTPIKIPVRYEESFNYDYVQIFNRLDSLPNLQTWYCFVTGREYISNNCTRLYLDIDYIQTFMFNKDGAPFWKTYGLVEMATIENFSVNRNQPAEFPVPARQTSFYWCNANKNFDIVVFSSVDLIKLDSTGEVVYQPASIGGVYTATPPYIAHGSTAAQRFVNIIAKLNEKGIGNAISGAYCVPSSYFNKYGTTEWELINHSNIDIDTITVTPPSDIGGYVPKNNILLRGDYCVITVNNCQGETALYKFDDFIGPPTFRTTISFMGGTPTLHIYPGTNFKYGNNESFRDYILKTVSPVTASFTNDEYTIWLAQNSNSRRANINAATIELNNAHRARDYVLSTKLDSMLTSITDSLKDRYTTKPGNDFLDAANYLANKDIESFKGWLKDENPYVISATRKAATGLIGMVGLGIEKAKGTEEEIRARNARTESVIDLGAAAIRNQFGFEHSFVYDNAVASAQANVERVAAMYLDKEVTPNSIVGSNTYGDIVRFDQHAFTISVSTPTPEWAVKIDKMLSASGCLINQQLNVEKHHQIFDFYKVQSPWVLAERTGRPQYVRNMMVKLFEQGFYLWYFNNNDISEYIGLPYDISNPPVGNG